ncbi:hypothetical protein ETB97_008573 [Aspergillus alliaceus]|uniref:Uncharacterized protein n=1 Tax=Petromyces alliaceus TaxID=209559 RepID=A0A8H5ZXJ0_PETAA|nr:hypothetical protein ETB97_008573 [Aspergillus burnettii]
MVKMRFAVSNRDWNILAILATISGDWHRFESFRYEDIGNQHFPAMAFMCSPRILSRLRLVISARKTAKRPFKGTLQEALLAVKFVRQNLNNRTLLETADSFTMRARKVERLLGSWPQYQVDTRLVEVVESIHRLQQIGGLADLIRTILNKDMSPTSRKSLLSIVSKVARYWEVARFL